MFWSSWARSMFEPLGQHKDNVNVVRDNIMISLLLFCRTWVGKRHLEEAMELRKDKVNFEKRWRSVSKQVVVGRVFVHKLF